MNKSFEFESRTMRDPASPNHFAQLEIDVLIECYDRKGCDATFDIEWVALKGSSEPLKLDELSPEDQLYIERQAEDLANEYACDAYQSYAEGAADAAYDAWKDEQMERGE